MAGRNVLRLIIYDITSDKRRRHVAKVLEDRCVRVQDSAYEARLSAAQLDRLEAKLTRIITEDDNLRIYTVPQNALPSCRIHGGPRIADGARFWLY